LLTPTKNDYLADLDLNGIFLLGDYRAKTMSGSNSATNFCQWFPSVYGVTTMWSLASNAIGILDRDDRE